MTEHQQVVVVDYDPSWPAIFARERERILTALADVDPPVAAVEHVGSTAVPGLAAKAIIDILVGFERLAPVECFEEPLRSIGYEFVPMPQFTESYFFAYGTWPAATRHLHLTAVGSRFWRDNIRFRDALRASPTLAAEYAHLKRRLGARFANDRSAYTQAKGPFITNVLEAEPSSQAAGGDRDERPS